MFFRMCDSDRERYGGPEWVEFDEQELYDAPASELAEYEQLMGFSLYELLMELYAVSARSTRGALFVGRRRAGTRETWESFDPKPLQCKRRLTMPTGDAPETLPPPVESPGNVEADEPSPDSSPSSTSGA